MASAAPGSVLDALLRGLAAQGHGRSPEAGGDPAAYPIAGIVDLVALAQTVESAVRGHTPDEEEAKTPAELNAANDG